MFSFWHVPLSLRMQCGKTKVDVILIYSHVKSLAITPKREEEIRGRNEGMGVIICV